MVSIWRGENCRKDTTMCVRCLNGCYMLPSSAASFVHTHLFLCPISPDILTHIHSHLQMAWVGVGSAAGADKWRACLCCLWMCAWRSASGESASTMKKESRRERENTAQHKTYQKISIHISKFPFAALAMQRRTGTIPKRGWESEWAMAARSPMKCWRIDKPVAWWNGMKRFKCHLSLFHYWRWCYISLYYVDVHIYTMNTYGMDFMCVCRRAYTANFHMLCPCEWRYLKLHNYLRHCVGRIEYPQIDPIAVFKIPFYFMNACVKLLLNAKNCYLCYWAAGSERSVSHSCDHRIVANVKIC